MAKAKKLPSGSWRARVSYTGADGKRHYESFTASTKKEAEFMAAEFALERKNMDDRQNWPLGKAIDEYIDLKEPVLAPSTIAGYRKVRAHSFQGIMDIPIKKLTTTMLQEAVNEEMLRKPKQKHGTVSPKTVKNEYGLLSSTLRMFCPGKVFRIVLPKQARRIRSLPLPSEIYNAVKGTDIELPVLLSMWLSFTMSEIRGLTKSKSIDGEFITIREVLVEVNGADVRKDIGKEISRNRRHHMPDRIRELIDQVDGDIIVPMKAQSLLWYFQKAIRRAGLPKITFHDLRHVNATLMATLQIPDTYAKDRGGWKTDHIMKSVYTETFSEERQKVDKIIDKYFEEFV